MAIQVVNKRFHKPTPNDYYIGRPSVLGNRFTHLSSKFPDVIKVATRDEAVAKYKDWILEQLKTNEAVQNEIAQLAELYHNGQNINLVCYCAPNSCHGQIIKEVIESL